MTMRFSNDKVVVFWCVWVFFNISSVASHQRIGGLLLTIWRCGDQFSKDMSTLLTILSVVTSSRKTRVCYWLSVGVVAMQISKDRFCFVFICFFGFLFVLLFCFYVVFTDHL